LRHRDRAQGGEHDGDVLRPASSHERGDERIPHCERGSTRADAAQDDFARIERAIGAHALISRRCGRHDRQSVADVQGFELRIERVEVYRFENRRRATRLRREKAVWRSRLGIDGIVDVRERLQFCSAGGEHGDEPRDASVDLAAHGLFITRGIDIERNETERPRAIMRVRDGEPRTGPGREAYGRKSEPLHLDCQRDDRRTDAHVCEPDHRGARAELSKLVRRRCDVGARLAADRCAPVEEAGDAVCAEGVLEPWIDEPVTSHIHLLIVVEEEGACRERARIRPRRKGDARQLEPAARIEQTFGFDRMKRLGGFHYEGHRLRVDILAQGRVLSFVSRSKAGKSRRQGRPSRAVEHASFSQREPYRQVAFEPPVRVRNHAHGP
jgi:hypothetical protein